MRRLYLLAAALLASFVVLSACSKSSSDSEHSLSQHFSLNATFGDRDISTFTVTSVGPIWAEASWAGSATDLALILNGPGQVSYFERVDGHSPLSLSYAVTDTDLTKGTEWTISVVNFGGGLADGVVKITYPAD
jgi:hypothetical protein